MKDCIQDRQANPGLQNPMLDEVLAWAKEVGEDRHAIYELEKIPARMGMLDEEIGLIPASVAHFDKQIAKTAYGVVSSARDLDTARRRGNSRARALIERFFLDHGTDRVSDEVRESYTKVITLIEENEGFVEQGARFSTGAHKPFMTLRARAKFDLKALDQDEIDRIWKDATSEARKSIRKAINRITDAKRRHNQWPELANLLPVAELHAPASPDRAKRICWDNLPDAFRQDAEAVFDRTLRKPEDLKKWAREQVKLGRSMIEIDAEVSAMKDDRKRIPRNWENALAGYRQAATWLAREQETAEAGFAELHDLGSLFTADALEAACAAQIARSKGSLNLKDPEESATMWVRITNLTTIARHGLRDEEALAAIKITRLLYDDYILSPSAMTADVEAVVDRLRKNPHLAAAYVNAPVRLQDAARLALEGNAGSGTWAEEKALRLFATAAARAIQVSRPLRAKNLFYARIRATEKCARNINWVVEGRHAEIRFAGDEVKNGVPLVVTVSDADAAALWDWQTVHRPRFLEMRGLDDTPYLFPGTATPRLQSHRAPLPPGCMSISALGELWDLGERRLGLGLTPHQCRHATATLMLAVNPGAYGAVASVLGNTEDVARAHYGKDSGEQAAAAVRASLLANHPDIFKRMKGKT